MILYRPNPYLILHPSLYPYLVIHILYINSIEDIVFSSRFYLHLILVKDHSNEETYKPFVEENILQFLQIIDHFWPYTLRAVLQMAVPLQTQICVLSHSGTKPSSSSVEACRWGATGHISDATTGVSPAPRLWTTCTSSWGATTTLGRRWPVTRRCSCSGSSSKPTSSKTSRVATGQRTLKTVDNSTGMFSQLSPISEQIITWNTCAASSWESY